MFLGALKSRPAGCGVHRFYCVISASVFGQQLVEITGWSWLFSFGAVWVCFLCRPVLFQNFGEEIHGNGRSFSQWPLNILKKKFKNWNRYINYHLLILASSLTKERKGKKIGEKRRKFHTVNCNGRILSRVVISIAYRTSKTTKLGNYLQQG